MYRTLLRTYFCNLNFFPKLEVITKVRIRIEAVYFATYKTLKLMGNRIMFNS